jgi:hypothetical protein
MASAPRARTLLAKFNSLMSPEFSLLVKNYSLFPI